MEQKKLNGVLLNNAAMYGMYLGIYFVLKYILYINMIPHFILTIPYYLLTILVPFIVYFLIKDFKKRNQDINITFLALWRYGVLLYFFASIISMFAHYYYFKFKFIDNMYTIKSMLEQYNSSALISPQVLDIFDESLAKSVDIPTYQLVLNDFGSNIIGGAFISLVIAFILRKK